MASNPTSQHAHSPTSQHHQPTQDQPLLRLKGAPLSVLLSLACDGAQSGADLAPRTGWWDGAVRRALQQLQQLELAQQLTYRSWVLRPGVDVVLLLGLPCPATSPPPETGPDHASPEVRSHHASPSEVRVNHASPSEVGSHHVSSHVRSHHTSPSEVRSSHVSEPQVRFNHISPEVRSNHVSPSEVGFNHASDPVPTAPTHPEVRSNHVSPSEVGSDHTSAPHDDVTYKHDHLDKQKNQTTNIQPILDDLQNLNPPFDGAAANGSIQDTNVDGAVSDNDVGPFEPVTDLTTGENLTRRRRYGQTPWARGFCCEKLM